MEERAVGAQAPRAGAEAPGAGAAVQTARLRGHHVLHPLKHPFSDSYCFLVLFLRDRLCDTGIPGSDGISRQSPSLPHVLWNRLACLLEQRDEFSQVMHIWKVDAPVDTEGLECFLCGLLRIKA